MLKIIATIFPSIAMVWLIYKFAIKPTYNHFNDEIRELKSEKEFEKSREDKEKYLDSLLSGEIKTDKIYFEFDNKSFISKTKNARRVIVLIATFLLILALFGLFYGYTNHIEGLVQNGILCFFGSIACFIYYAIRFSDKSDEVAKYQVYYDINRDIILLDASVVESDSPVRLKYANKVIYLIKSVSYIFVDKDSIILNGDIIRVECYGNISDDSYIDHIQINKEVAFKSDGWNVSMFSNKVQSVKIWRGYFGFEKFLRLKKYNGSENLR